MIAGQRIGPFEIDKEIGSGAMGTVYRARFHKDDQKVIPVAFKVIALGLLGNEGAMARFEREANILKQLRHKHIVRLIGTGKYKQTPFIAMEFVEGDTLDKVLSSRQRMGWEDVIVYTKQLCDALQYAHEKGIIHRDLKPSNLMITRDGVLKLTDFGIAKDTDVTALTGQNSTIGTAAYMSPEQCKGDRNLTNKSDLYSLGVVLYELLTGKKPFVAENTVDMFLKHVNDKPVRPSRLVPDLPVWLDNLVMFLLEKEIDKRPLDAATVKMMLENIEDKMQAQQSVGADIANARRVDRPLAGQSLDADDKEAARSLRDANRQKSGKKARKKKTVHITEKAWFKAIPLVVVLAIVIGALAYFLQPASRDDLVRSWRNAGTADARLEAAQRYLNRYGDDGSDTTAEVRASLREIHGERLQSVLDKRFRNRLGALKFDTAQEDEDPEAYAAAWSALEAEDAGELNQAIGFWKKIQERGPIEDRFGEGWKWLAEKHLGVLNSLDKKLAELRTELRDAASKELPWKFDPTQPDSLAKLAVRLDPGSRPISGDSTAFAPNRKILPHIQDPAKARKTWASLAEMTRDKPEMLQWHLLAARERDQRPDTKTEEAVKARVEKAEPILAAVTAEWQRVGQSLDLTAEQRDCRNRCRDLFELYDDESDEKMKAIVTQARELYKRMQPR